MAVLHALVGAFVGLFPVTRRVDADTAYDTAKVTFTETPFDVDGVPHIRIADPFCGLEMSGPAEHRSLQRWLFRERWKHFHRYVTRH